LSTTYCRKMTNIIHRPLKVIALMQMTFRSSAMSSANSCKTYI
jgi:hypothetical protein